MILLWKETKTEPASPYSGALQFADRAGPVQPYPLMDNPNVPRETLVL